MKVRNGATETATRDGVVSLSVTIFEDGRMGSAATSAVTPDAIRTTVERAVAIARQVQGDRYAGLADPEWLAVNGEDVELFAPSGLSAPALGAAAVAIEDAALEAATGLDCSVRIMEAAATSHDFRWAHAIGQDFLRSGSASSQNRWCVAIAEGDGAMASDSWSSTDRRTGRLRSADVVGQTAVARAARKLGGRALASRSAPVLFDAVIATSLVRDLANALMGMAQHQKSTFLAGTLGSGVLAEHIDLVEDPFESFGLASGAFDGEGVAGTRRHIVRAGVVEGYFLSSLSARRLGLDPTGNADGVRNLTMTSRSTAADDGLADMLRRLDRGLWVTEFVGGSVDPVTGAYSKAACGFWIENGQVAFPVQDITVAGELPRMFRGIQAIGADTHRAGAIRTGSILVDAMQIAGR